MYLDEQPITTIQGALDVHIYDIARVEALAGPQGTLYGASSQAGTIRIITNKPDPTGFPRATASKATRVDDGGIGYTRRGLRQPADQRQRRDPPGRLVPSTTPGYIDNVHRDAHVPDASGITIDNANRSRRTTTTVENYRRARRAQARPQRQLDRHAQR